ncbi:MAG TPA: hypothetical protein VMW28_08725 [Pelolinea sp.]|nr:hypothetical protein [Pelolinea sp.]
MRKTRLCWRMRWSSPAQHWRIFSGTGCEGYLGEIYWFWKHQYAGDPPESFSNDQRLRSLSRRAETFRGSAVWYLCQCQKDHSSDEMVNWIIHASELGKAKPEIPDYVLDMHTAEGQKKGRGRKYFFDEASRTAPELPVRDKTYLKRIIKMLDEGELAD